MVSKELLLEADHDFNITGYVYPNNKDLERLPIYYEKKVVGFATPRQEKDSVWRMGAIYITPKFRKKGLASKTIEKFMLGKKGRAFIEKENIASKISYFKAGFRQGAISQNGEGSWWQNY